MLSQLNRCRSVSMPLDKHKTIQPSPPGITKSGYVRAQIRRLRRIHKRLFHLNRHLLDRPGPIILLPRLYEILDSLHLLLHDVGPDAEDFDLVGVEEVVLEVELGEV